MPAPHPFQPPDKKLEKWKSPVAGYEGRHPNRVLVMEAFFDAHPDIRHLPVWDFVAYITTALGDHRAEMTSHANSELLFRTDLPWKSVPYATILRCMLSWFAQKKAWPALEPAWDGLWLIRAHRGGGQSRHMVYDLALWPSSRHDVPARLVFGVTTRHLHWMEDRHLEKLIHAFFSCAAVGEASYGRGRLGWAKSTYDLHPEFDDEAGRCLWRHVHHPRPGTAVPGVYGIDFLGKARLRQVGGVEAILDPLKVIDHGIRCTPMTDGLLISIGSIAGSALRSGAGDEAPDFQRSTYMGFEQRWLLSRFSRAGMLPMQDMKWVENEIEETRQWQAKERRQREERRRPRQEDRPRPRSLESWLKDLASRPPHCLKAVATPAADPLRGELAGHLHDGVTHFHIRPLGKPAGLTLYGRAIAGEPTLGSPIRAGSMKPDRALFTFDEVTDGWDGEQGGEKRPDEPRLKQFKCPRCDGRHFNLRAALKYDDDLEESLTDEQKNHAEDFFSWFWLIARCPACNWEGLAADIECA